MTGQHSLLLQPDPAALAILRRLRAAGYESYFCGGCVRDALLGRAPADWDIATAAMPEEIELLFERTEGVGRAFGVMLVVQEGRAYEVATFRADAPTGDGRRPDSVRFSSAEEDVRRRDFTVNGLLYDPGGRGVIDLVGGREDLAARRIRSIGPAELRFREDYLRLLRAVRFAATLDFSLEEETAQALRELAGLVRLVAAERTGEELTKLLAGGGAGRGLRLLADGQLLPHLLPEAAALIGMPQPPEFHPEGDVFNHTALMLDLLAPGAPPALGWAVLLHDIGKPLTLSVRDRIRFDNHQEAGAELAAAILERLKRPRRLIEEVAELIRGHMRFSALPEMRRAKQRRWIRDPLFPLHLELHRLDCLASHRKLGVYDFAARALAEEEAIPDPPEPLLTGRDLIALGHAPGPAFAAMLEAVEDERLEGRLEDRDAALAFVRERFPLPESGTGRS